MSILEELKKYAHECINDVIVSSKKHKWACERFLKDLENPKFYWDEEEAQRIYKWFTYLRHSKGELAKQPIILTTWQKFVMCQIHAWRRQEDGLRRFKQAFIIVGRKNAKTQMQAGNVLYEISVVATRNREVAETYCAGTKKDQSLLLFKECKNMLRGSLLSPRFKITGNQLTHIKTGSFLTPLSKQDGKDGDGTNPAVLILDEYHQHKTTEFYDLGLGSNSKEPLLFIITTAGADLDVPCYTQEYQYCSSILNPNLDVSNDEYFVDVHEAEEGDPLDDLNTWKKANPLRAYYDEGVEKLQTAYNVAKEIPEKMTAFKTKCLNMWLNKKADSYMDMSKWKACEVDKIPFDIKGQEVYVGFDMSAKIDLTSVSFVIPLKIEDTAKYVVYSHSFIPNYEKLRERITVDKMPYDSWVERGYITVTNTPIVDQEAVIEYVFEFCKNNDLKIKNLCFDPANASKLMMDLEKRGYECVEVYQSYRSLNESTAGFREQVYSKNVYYTYNPVLNFAMNNAMIRTSGGLIKIDKDITRKRIDAVIAVLGAYKLAQYHEFVLDLNKYRTPDYLRKLYKGGDNTE